MQTLEGLTNDERNSLIGLLREHKKYGQVWEDKPEDVEERLRESLPVLREVKDKAIIAGVAQSDLQPDCSEYKDFQSDKCITNADIHSERIANPLERVFLSNPTLLRNKAGLDRATRASNEPLRPLM